MIKLCNNILFILLLSLLTSTRQCLTFRVVAQDKMEDSGETTVRPSRNQTTYRQTVAQVKNSIYRVPDHLQFVPRGFIYEDADDVIHVIDPPKHFEELKKVMQRQQQQQMMGKKPIALRLQRPKPKIVKSVPSFASLRGEEPLRKAFKEQDLETQETQQLPVEILASVRKTEKYLKKFKPKLPLIKQRLKTKKIQTVIWQNAQDQQQYQHDQEFKAQALREQSTPQRRRYTTNNKRFRRDLSNVQETLKGDELIEHINELIKNATFYLQQTESYENFKELSSATYKPIETTSAATITDTLEGEILLTNVVQTTTTTSTPIPSRTLTPPAEDILNEDMVVKILENSVKATNVIMQQIKTQANLTNISEKCDYLSVTYPNHISNLQNQIKCMQNFIKVINEAEEQTPVAAAKKYGERLEERKSKDLRHKPFLVAQLGDDYIDDTAPSPVNKTLIYDDVMTTIRNMLQTQNLQSLDETALTEASITDIWQDSPYAYDNSHEPVDFHNLQEYLSSLHSIVENLHKFNDKSLNLQEVEGGVGSDGVSSTSKYYFINPEGKIYSLPQAFQKDLTTPKTAPPSPPPSLHSSIFRQFPDLPIVTEYLKNGTLLPPSRHAVEIL